MPMISAIKVAVATVLPESLDVDYLHDELQVMGWLKAWNGGTWLLTVHRD